MVQQHLRLYQIPAGTRESFCALGVCGKKIAFVPGVKPGSRVPVSLEHPDAERKAGVVVAAPSHFLDCAGANQFSKSGRRTRT